LTKGSGKILEGEINTHNIKVKVVIMSALEILLNSEGASSTLVSETFDSSKPRINNIPCCLCGTLIYPNAANQCGACLAQQFDLKALLNRGPGGGELTIHQCRECRMFERMPGKYEPCELESPELLSICCKHIPALVENGGAGISKIQIVDVAWVWSEPHSMRLRLKLTVRASVVDGSVQIQQTLMVKFVVKFQQCPDCKREYTSRTWQAVVQLRQKRSDGSPRKGIFLTEMAIRNNKDLRKLILNFETKRHGFDFYFLHLAQAQTFSQFLAKVAPMRIKTSTKLVSTDNHSNTANVKYTISCDIVPFGRDDLIVATRSGTDNGMGKLSGKLCLVTKCKTLVHLVNASPARTSMADATAELNPDKYWRAGEDRCFRILLSPIRMVRFVVLDVELCGNDQNAAFSSSPILYTGPQSGVEKYALADVQVVRESDFGVNDETFNCVTHLGHMLQSGDIVLGYDLQATVSLSDVMEDLGRYFHSSFVMPDVVLVRKIQGTAVMEEVAKDDKLSKPRAKSSASKKREKRKKKEEKKMLDLEKAASRMGFLGGDAIIEEDENDGFDLSSRERDAFEEQLLNDPELQMELRLAEQEINEQLAATPEALVNIEDDKEEHFTECNKSFSEDNLI